jgi:hypothetical protein
MDEQRREIALALMRSATAVVQGANPQIVIRSLGDRLREIGLGPAPDPAAEQGAVVVAQQAHLQPQQATQPAPRANPHREAVLRIFDHWRRACDHPQARLTQDRATRIQARLREGYTEQDVLAAVDGCAGSPFHRGENESATRYDDLTLICRNGSTLERFRDMAPSSQQPAHVVAPVQVDPEQVELDRQIRELEHKAQQQLKAGNVEGYGAAIRSVRELKARARVPS